MTTFEKLSAINVNERVEKKNGLTYLSWAWAWSEVKKACPDAIYKVGETDYDEAIGFMCHTTVTMDGETLEMWLPVMDSSNKSMKKIQYTVSTKYGDKTIEAATTFDINKTIMRCLVKNLAMFGLGLYIFAGEDLPESDSLEVVPQEVVLVDLVKDSDNWAKVVKYIEKNKNLGVKEIVQQLGRKYTMSAPIKKEIASLINS